MTLVRPPMTNLRMTVVADCTVFLHVPPPLLSIKALAFVQMAAFLRQLPTSKIKQTFFSTSLACLLAFSNHSFGNSISLSSIFTGLYPASLTRDLQQPPPPPASSPWQPVCSHPSQLRSFTDSLVLSGSWVWLTRFRMTGLSCRASPIHPPAAQAPLSFPGLWQAKLSTPSDRKPHHFLYVAFLFILQLSVHRLLPQGHYSWSQLR